MIQHAVVNYINLNYLKPQKLNLTLNSLSLSFFSAALNLNEVSIKEINSENNRKFNFSLNQISVAFDVPSSYFHRKPIVKKIFLRGTELNLNYDSNGKIILPDFLKTEDDSEIDVPKTIKKIMPNLPAEFDILNATVNLGQKESKNFQYINISLLKAKKVTDKKNIGLELSVNTNGTLLKFPFLHSKIQMNQFEMTGQLWQDGNVKIKSLNLDSNILKLSSSIHALIKSKIEQSNYEANIAALEIKGKDFFSLFDLTSKGTAKISGNLKSGKTLDSFPTFVGNAQWEKLFLQRFSLYNGTAEVSFKEKTVFYKRAKINTVRNGIINAEGKFELFGDFNFENLANIETFSFAELLDGFGISFSPVNFTIKSPEMRVNGKIFSKDPKKRFELYATGKASGQNLIVTTFEQNGRKPLPKFDLNLNLSANTKNISFDKSLISLLTNSHKSTIQVPQGFLDISTPKGVGVSVNLKGEKIDLSSLEYFLKLPTAGTASLDGTLSVVAPSTEILFKAKSTVTHGELAGMKFNKLVGEWGLDSKGIYAHKTQVNMGTDVTKLANFDIEKLRLNFGDLQTNIETTAQGNLNGMTSSLAYWIPTNLISTKGKIDDLSIKLDGLLLHPSTWNLQTNSKVNNLSLFNGGIKNLQLNLSCEIGNCQKSYLVMNSIHANPLQPQDHVEKGQILLQIDNLSFINSKFKAKFSQFPMRFFNINNSVQLDGVLDSDIILSGVWKNMIGSAQVGISSLQIKDIKLGDVKLTAQSNINQSIIFELSAFQNQFKSLFTFPQKDNIDSSLNITLKNFNAMQLLSDEIRANNNLFSQLTGHFNFQGILSPEIFKNPLKFLSRWKGGGQLTRGNLQYGNTILNLKESGNFTLSNNKVEIPNLSLNSDFINIETSGLVDLTEKTLSLPVKVDANFANLKNTFPNIFDDPSNGTAQAKVLISGDWDDILFDGGMSLSAKSISLKNYSPTLTNLQGQINFKNKLIEIQKISAKKGKGEISIAGNIDLSESQPNVSVRVNATKADFRIPVPVFLFMDLNLDSDININGKGKPYLVEGDINILKFQLLRELTCNQISTQFLALPKKDQTIIVDPLVNLDLNIRATSTINIQSQCLRGRFSTDPILNVSGTDSTPKMNGTILADSATLQVLKTSFDVKKAEFQFVDTQKYDPNVDIQMQGKVNTYNIYWKMNGRLSQARLDLNADPPVLSNGERIIDADIISMISTGQVPTQSSSTNILSASSGVASFLGINNFFDSTLNQTVNAMTGGLVDSVSVLPSSQNGQLSWRANASRSVSKRLDLGVSYEDGIAGSTESAYANYMFNDTVSLISSYNSTNFVQQNPTQEIFSGLRFQFGSRQ